MKADLSGEFRIRVALQRRSLAMDLVKIVSYSRMEAFHDHLFHLMMREVPDTHHNISMEQILRADKAAFISMVDTCRSGISINQAGIYPIEKALDEVFNGPIVSATLQPMPRTSHRRDGPYEKGERNHGKKGGKGEGKNGNKDKGGGKGAGKGSGAKAGKGTMMPAELVGLSGRNKQGTNLCYAWNMSCGCKHAKAGETCKRGLHSCMKCGGQHSAAECTVG